MSTNQVPDERPPRSFRVPRWIAFLLGLVVALGVYPVVVGLVPWAISEFTPRYGWTASGPAVWNLLGLILVVSGVAGLIWVFSVLLAQVFKLPEPIELEGTAQVLLTHGPFALSRNPMFLAGLTVWLGWGVYFGSLAVLVVSLVLWALTDRFTVPREERALELRFGEAYRVYKERVPRWLGLHRR
jgi:protein-S-isoprenylcysteine O-methyltransferase Ste14